MPEEQQEETGQEATEVQSRKKGISALGKYAFVPGGSEEFAREKQEEIAREDRPRS